MGLMSNVLFTILLFLKKATYTLADNDIFLWNLVIYLTQCVRMHLVLEDYNLDWDLTLICLWWIRNSFILKCVFTFKMCYNYRHNSFNKITFAFPCRIMHIISILRQGCSLKPFVFNIVKGHLSFLLQT